MDANDQNALLEQLAESSRRTADQMATLGAEMVSLRARVEQVDERLGELRATQQDGAERLERLASEVDRIRADRSLAGQLEALRSSQTDSQSQLERLEGQLRRVDRAEAAMAQLQREVGQQLEAQERALRGAITIEARQRGEDGAQVGRELRALGSKVEAALAHQEQLDALGHARDSARREQQELSARLDALSEEGHAREEALRRVEQSLESRIQGHDERLDQAEALVARWQERIERQLETVQEAQAIAQQMQVEAERLRRESHAAAEAWRVAEGRVDSSLADMRQGIEEQWQRLRSERRNDWEAHARQHESEQRGQREARELAMAELEQTVEGLREELETGLEVTGRDLIELKHRLGTYFRNLRDQVAEASEALAVQLPSDDPAAVDPERRQALRRALRARRAARGG